MSLPDQNPSGLGDDEADIAREHIFVRAIRLPTKSLTQARTAVDLQIDKLSPVPKHLAEFDLVTLEQADGTVLYAVGITTRAVIEEAGHKAAARSKLRATASLDGRPIRFTFANRAFYQRRRDLLSKWVPSALLVMAALEILLAASTARVRRETAYLAEVSRSLAHEQRKAAEAAREQQSAWSAWSGSSADQAAANVLCTLSRLANALPSGVVLTSLDAGGGAVDVSFYRKPPNPVLVEFSETRGASWNQIGGGTWHVRQAGGACD